LSLPEDFLDLKFQKIKTWIVQKISSDNNDSKVVLGLAKNYRDGSDVLPLGVETPVATTCP